MPTNAQRHAWTTLAAFAPLYLLLAWNNPWSAGDIPLLLYLTNWVIILHVTLGAYVMVRHLQQSNSPRQIVIDTAMLLLLYASAWFMRGLALFATTYGVFFSLAILKYARLGKKAKSVTDVDYIHLKIRNESPVVLLFFLVAILAYVFADQPAMIALLQACTFAIAVGFLFWLVVAKRAYHWVFRAQ